MKKLFLLLFFYLFTCQISISAERPEWMDLEGIVMAGSWEAPAFRARRAGYKDFKMPAEWLPGYQREHSQEMIDSLKAIGVNFIMTHGYKGYGFDIEGQGMQDAARFTRLAHTSGMRVGAYIGSTLGWETLFKEMPDAKNWLWRDATGNPGLYSKTQPHRYLAMKNNPGYKEYIKKAIRFAMEEMKVDLIHLDNTSQIGTGWDETSISQFREYLRRHNRSFADKARPPIDAASSPPQLWHDWVEYRTEALEQYYKEMAEYVHSLNPNCTIDINPGSISRKLILRGVNLGRLLQYGQAYWDESKSTGWIDGLPQTHICSYKIGQTFDNSVFLYCETPLDVAEAMAFNRDCLGCVTWFQGGKLLSGHVGRIGTFPRNILPFIHFFHNHHTYFRNAIPVADVAVLFDFETLAFGSREAYTSLLKAETLLQNLRIPHAIIFNAQQLQFNNWPAIIASPGYQFQNFNGQILRTNDVALEKKLASLSRITISAPGSVLLELQQQQNPHRWLLHLVNYNVRQKIRNIDISIKIPRQVNTITVFDPQNPKEHSLQFDQQDSKIHFILPEMNIYRLIVIN